jgi:serine/threonine protein kinase/streptogramin lyase
MDAREGMTRLPGELEPGTTFAGYEIISVLGRGGMGVVYLAEQSQLGRKVALKLLPPQLAEDERFRERFVRESRLAAALDHPNVVPIHEAGEVDGRLFISMRYVEGTDLRALLRQHGALVPARAGAIVAQVADALETAHERGLVHRDVKPANVLVSRGSGSKGPEHVYLSDFGLTKRSTSDSGLTATGQFVGTIDYAAPEQFEGGQVGAATDVYSLGCVLYECLTGQPPFPRENDAALMRAHLMDHPSPPSSGNPDVPEVLDGVVARAMAKRPRDRYPSAGALADAVREATHLHPGAAARPRWRRPSGWVLGTAAAVIGVVIIAVILLNRPVDTDDGSSATTTLPLDSVAEIDPGTGRPGTIVDELSVRIGGGGAPPRIDVGEGGVWVVDTDWVTHVDPRTSEVEAQIPYGGESLGGLLPAVAADFRTVWVTGQIAAAEHGSLELINPATNERIRRIIFEDRGSATGVATGDGSVWESFARGSVLEIDPGTVMVEGDYEVGGSLDALAVGGGAVWVGDDLAGTVSRIDTRTGEIASAVQLPGGVDAIAADESGAWVLDDAAGSVTPVDQGGDVARPIRVGAEPSDITAGLGAIWVSDAEGFVYRIDPITKEVTQLELGGPIAALGVDEENGSLWVLVFEP